MPLANMDRFEGDRSVIVGSVAAGGTLALMIPPSAGMIIIGLLTEQSIGRLFIAGAIPGVMLAALFATYIYIRKSIERRRAGLPSLPKASWRDRFTVFSGIIPFIGIVVVVLGTIYMGIASATEAAALGVSATLVFTLVTRRVSFRDLPQIFLGALTLAGFVLILIVSAKSFAMFLSYLQIPQQLAATVLAMGLPSVLVLAAIMVVALFLGCFMEGVGLLVLTVPIFFPVITGLGYSGLWFGVFIIVANELALITPPVGLNVYVIKGIGEPYGVTMAFAFKSIAPFVVLMLIGAAILVAFPILADWLPSTMIRIGR